MAGALVMLAACGGSPSANEADPRGDAAPAPSWSRVQPATVLTAQRLIELKGFEASRPPAGPPPEARMGQAYGAATVQSDVSRVELRASEPSEPSRRR